MKHCLKTVLTVLGLMLALWSAQARYPALVYS